MAQLNGTQKHRGFPACWADDRCCPRMSFGFIGGQMEGEAATRRGLQAVDTCSLTPKDAPFTLDGLTSNFLFPSLCFVNFCFLFVRAHTFHLEAHHVFEHDFPEMCVHDLHVGPNTEH